MNTFSSYLNRYLLRYVWRNKKTKTLISVEYFRTIYLGLFRSILEFGGAVRHQCLAKATRPCPKQIFVLRLFYPRDKACFPATIPLPVVLSIFLFFPREAWFRICFFSPKWFNNKCSPCSSYSSFLEIISFSRERLMEK